MVFELCVERGGEIDVQVRKEFVGRQDGEVVWNRIGIQGLDDVDGQGFDWLGSLYRGLAKYDRSYAGTPIFVHVEHCYFSFSL